jgi:MFS family permease
LNLQNQPQMHDRLRRLTLINSVIGISIAGISTRVFVISVPTLAAALGTDILGISWALIVYQMAAIGLGVVCGRLGDIHGHHKIYGFGMAVMAVGSLLCGLSQDVFQLILFRFVQGVGGAMIQSSGRTLAFKAMPVGSEGKAQGLMTMSHQFGFFVGPPLGGLIIDWVHWRGIFFLLLLPSLVGMALCYMTGRAVAPSAARRESIDYWGAFLFLGLTILVTMLLDQKIAQVLGAGSRALLGLVFVGTLWGFISHEKTARSPIGANLQADSHWLLPTILLALMGIGSAFFNTPSQAVMVISLPKEHWGIAIGIINAIFGLGQMLGISLSGIFLTLAFRFYSGNPETSPDPTDTQVFVASMNVTYLFALGISLIPLLTAIKMRRPFERYSNVPA